MNYYDQYKQLLNKMEVHYQEHPGDDGEKGISFSVGVSDREDLIVIGVFDANESVFDLTIANVATITSILKREDVLKTLNELNSIVRYGSFSVKDDGRVICRHSILLPKNKNEEIVLANIFHVLELMTSTVVTDAYPRLMRIQWL